MLLINESWVGVLLFALRFLSLSRSNIPSTSTSISTAPTPIPLLPCHAQRRFKTEALTTCVTPSLGQCSTFLSRTSVPVRPYRCCETITYLLSIYSRWQSLPERIQPEGSSITFFSSAFIRLTNSAVGLQLDWLGLDDSLSSWRRVPQYRRFTCQRNPADCFQRTFCVARLA